MKKKKLLKSVSLVALSAVMMCGVAAGFAGCGGSKAYQISVSMFCGDTDVDINRKNCTDWAEQYTAKLRSPEGVDGHKFTEEDKDITIKFSYQTNTDAYFDQLKSQIASNSQPDVFYVSPKYVKAWSNANRILDLSEALAADAKKVTGKGGIWEDSLAFYGYSKDERYTSGDRITFDEGKNKFVTADGVEVGIYGLPKDYSNFGLGFNEVFFTNEVRKALTSTYTSDRTGVPGAEYNSSKLSYGAEEGIVTDENGQDVPLVNIGKPTYYKPYNFYNYANFTAALQAGDPMATAVNYFTDGKGYCVTIPGWPGDTFVDAKASAEKTNVDAEYADPWADADTTVPDDYIDEDATYDTKNAYITYTYAEYSALTWIITYYTNTYDWQGNGKGGCKVSGGNVVNVYGNDQYDGVLYLLPWLAGNDAQYLDEKSTTALNGNNPATTIGTDTYKMNHKKLNGETEEIDVQYGINSQRFLETVGAFHAYGSDWNGNSNNAGDTTIEKSSGWDLFVRGNCVFYGVGTWNAGALNATDREFLRYRLMPEPISENYALSSYIKDEDYNMKGYVWNADKNEATVTEGKAFAPATFEIDEIKENQLLRQDQWGARMDSVGYGVSTNVSEGGEWRTAAAIALVKYLTITESTQVALTYSGSQLPNFKSQCNDFYLGEGDFADMVTPDDGETFDKAYEVAKAMYADSLKAGSDAVSIESWMTANGNDVKYNVAFKDDPLSSLLSLATAMKILNLIVYNQADRDLSLRMQYGLNATRDSAMYTYNDDWIGVLEPRGSGLVMAYDQQSAHGTEMLKILKNIYRSDRANELPTKGNGYGTPAWWCLNKAQTSQTTLLDAIQEEKDLMG